MDKLQLDYYAEHYKVPMTAWLEDKETIRVYQFEYVDCRATYKSTKSLWRAEEKGVLYRKVELYMIEELVDDDDEEDFKSEWEKDDDD